MNCENYLCVFWEKDKCTLTEVSLDIIGQCTKCIYIDINSKIIEKQRQQMLKSFQKCEKIPKGN